MVTNTNNGIMKYIIQVKEPNSPWEDISYPKDGQELMDFDYFVSLESNVDYLKYRLIRQETVLSWPTQ